MDKEQGDIRPYANEEDVTTLIQSLYGLKVVKLKKLNGYDDQNFYVIVDSEHNENKHIDHPLTEGYVFKVMNTDDSIIGLDHLNGQIACLKWLNEKGITCPKHVPDKTGNLFSVQPLPNKSRTGSSRHAVRLLEYIDGTILANVEVTPDVAYKGGVFVANLTRAMEGFKDERVRKDDYLWSMKNIHKVANYVKFVESEEHRTLVEQVLSRWNSLKPQFSLLNEVVIHSDVNEQNMLVTTENGCTEIAGLLDFQDMGYGYVIFDLAIYIMYMMTAYEGEDNPVEIGGYCLQGFAKSYPLSDAELSLLHVSIAARLIQSLVLGAYNYSLYKDPYLLITQKNGWKALTSLWSRSSDDLLVYWSSEKFSKVHAVY